MHCYIANKNMKAGSLLSIAKVFAKSKKVKILLVGAQLGYLGYTYLKNRNQHKTEVTQEQ